MAFKIEGSVLSEESDVLAGATVHEINEFGFPVANYKTDNDGKFSLNVASKDSLIRFKHFGYNDLEMKASEFYSVAYLKPAVNIVVAGKNSNTLLYVLLAAAALTAIYYATRPKKPQPKKVKI